MSNINQTQGLFALDIVQDLGNETVAAIHGGAKIKVWMGKDFKGYSRVYTNRTGEFRWFPLISGGIDNAVNNNISSVEVLSGVWDLRNDRLGGGSGVRLRPGRYPRLSRSIDNKASSIISLG
jgi:hypothetical protein